MNAKSHCKYKSCGPLLLNRISTFFKYQKQTWQIIVHEKSSLELGTPTNYSYHILTMYHNKQVDITMIAITGVEKHELICDTFVMFHKHNSSIR